MGFNGASSTGGGSSSIGQTSCSRHPEVVLQRDEATNTFRSCPMCDLEVQQQHEQKELLQRLQKARAEEQQAGWSDGANADGQPDGDSNNHGGAQQPQQSKPLEIETKQNFDDVSEDDLQGSSRSLPVPNLKSPEEKPMKKMQNDTNLVMFLFNEIQSLRMTVQQQASLLTTLRQVVDENHKEVHRDLRRILSAVSSSSASVASSTMRSRQSEVDHGAAQREESVDSIKSRLSTKSKSSMRSSQSHPSEVEAALRNVSLQDRHPQPKTHDSDHNDIHGRQQQPPNFKMEREDSLNPLAWEITVQEPWSEERARTTDDNKRQQYRPKEGGPLEIVLEGSHPSILDGNMPTPEDIFGETNKPRQAQPKKNTNSSNTKNGNNSNGNFSSWTPSGEIFVGNERNASSRVLPSTPEEIFRSDRPQTSSHKPSASRPPSIKEMEFATHNTKYSNNPVKRDDRQTPPPPAASQKQWEKQQKTFHPPSPPPQRRRTLPRLGDIVEVGGVGESRADVSVITMDPHILESKKALMDKKKDEKKDKNGLFPVTGLRLSDKHGDEGEYTGTLSINDGEPSGFGTMKYDNGRRYRGDWKAGRWHGKGCLKDASGDTYEGDFEHEKRHGKGVYKFVSGDVYDGDFCNDKRHGKGKFMFKNGSVYKGGFVEGSFEGYGFYEFRGGYYEGEWKNGVYFGVGTLQYANGGHYTGQFLEGLAHGLGEELAADGTCRKGVWNAGVLVQAGDFEPITDII